MAGGPLTTPDPPAAPRSVIDLTSTSIDDDRQVELPFSA
jgi:hypothetical protein